MRQSAADDSLFASFLNGEPGAPHWNKRLGITLHYRSKEMLCAALLLRQHGPNYLRYVAMSVIAGKLKDFVQDNFWHIYNDAFLKNFDDSYASHVSRGSKEKLAEALAASTIFQPRNALTLFPLVPVQVSSDFDSDPFFLIQPISLNEARLPNTNMRAITPTTFPPFMDGKLRKEMPGAWLGVRSPAIQASNKLKSAILGALALTVPTQYRYQFTLRATFGGQCTIDGGETGYSFGDSHTPALGNDIVVSERDHSWLGVLATKLASDEKAVRRQIRALEYFYRAWPLDSSERFPFLCMTLDAIFGDMPRPTKETTDTQIIVHGIRDSIGTYLNEDRLRFLMKLRA